MIISLVRSYSVVFFSSVIAPLMAWYTSGPLQETDTEYDIKHVMDDYLFGF